MPEMNAATLLDFPPPRPTPRDLMLRALDPHLLIGMPHLNAHGLSETWLMKELGHRHWLMLAEQLGMPDADFRTTDGEEVYAAICATSLEEARFQDVQANDVLTIHSTLAPASRTRTATRHTVTVRGRLIATCELVSTFVRRHVTGDNHSIARVTLPARTIKDFEPGKLAATAGDLKSGRLATYRNFPLAAGTALRTYRFQPSPSQEFNGAGLFYFAQFQAVMDRAFEIWFSDSRRISGRECFFFGNIAPGEAIRFNLLGLSADTSSAYGQLCREQGKVIALLFAEWDLSSGPS